MSTKDNRFAVKREAWKLNLEMCLEAIKVDRERQLQEAGISKPAVDLTIMKIGAEVGRLLDECAKVSTEPYSKPADARSILLSRARGVASKATFLMQLIQFGEA